MQAEPVDEQVRLKLIIADYAKICEASSREIAGLRCRIKKLERLLEILGWEPTGAVTPDPRPPECKVVKYSQPFTDDFEPSVQQQELFAQ